MDGIGWAKPQSVHCHGSNRQRTTDTDDGWGVGQPSVKKKASVRPFKGIKMSAPALEGRQDDDDILGIPGDGFVDKTDVNPGVPGEHDEEGDDARSNEGSARKRRKSAVVAPDSHVTARIKPLMPTSSSTTSCRKPRSRRQMLQGLKRSYFCRGRPPCCVQGWLDCMT
jgi:hypothetical protein